MARLSPVDRLAELMAEGCPSILDAARRMRITAAEAEKHWRAICKGLGPQAR
jgi:hypothetical protein